MACPTYDYARHAVFDLCRIVSGFFPLRARRHTKQGFTGNLSQEVWALAREISHNSVGRFVFLLSSH